MVILHNNSGATLRGMALAAGLFAVIACPGCIDRADRRATEVHDRLMSLIGADVSGLTFFSIGSKETASVHLRVRDAGQLSVTIPPTRDVLNPGEFLIARIGLLEVVARNSMAGGGPGTSSLLSLGPKGAHAGFLPVQVHGWQDLVDRYQQVLSFVALLPEWPEEREFDGAGGVTYWLSRKPASGPDRTLKTPQVAGSPVRRDLAAEQLMDAAERHGLQVTSIRYPSSFAWVEIALSDGKQVVIRWAEMGQDTAKSRMDLDRKMRNLVQVMRTPTGREMKEFRAIESNRVQATKQ